MKIDLSNKTILIVDYGTNIDFAIKMTETYGRVLFYSPYEEAYPNPYRHRIGTGIKGVEKIDNIWDYYADVDIWAFPHLFQGSFQNWLRADGRLVYGTGKGEDLEIYRDKFKLLQKELGMPLNQYVEKIGIDELCEYLKQHENLYIKNNIYRGLMETWHHDNYEVSKPYLDFLRSEYGMYQDREKFIVEYPIENAIEYGFDGFCINGSFTEKTIFGLEVKDCAYCCKFVSYKDLPKAVLRANEKLAPIMDAYNYRCWYSNEMRSISKDEAIITDMTCRHASPPTSLAMEMFEDFGKYVWEVASGEVPAIKSKYKYGCQLIMSSEWARKEPLAITFPPQYKNNVKIKNLSIEDGVHWFLPQIDELIQVGCILGMGDTLNQARDQATAIAKEVKGFLLDTHCGSLDDAQIEIDKLKKNGINIF